MQDKLVTYHYNNVILNAPCLPGQLALSRDEGRKQIASQGLCIQMESPYAGIALVYINLHIYT